MSARRVVSTPARTVDGTVDTDKGGGLSPVVIVLIAVAALAVLSAGVAFFNERLRARRR